MVTYYLEKEYKTNIEITKLKKEYIEIFGKPDAYRDAEAPNKTSGSFGMIWGGEPEEGYFEPKFPHVKVKCSYERVKNSLSIKESLRIMDIYKVMAIRYSNSLEQYINNIKALNKSK